MGYAGPACIRAPGPAPIPQRCVPLAGPGRAPALTLGGWGGRFIDRAVSGPELVSGSHVHSLGISYRVPVLPGPGEAPLPMPTVPLTVFLGEIGEHI